MAWSEHSPAFRFYPKDFLTSIGQASMSCAEAGAYIRLLCHCWLEGEIPDDPVACARLAGTTAIQMRKMWPVLAARFQPENGILRHRRLDLERKKQETYRALQQIKGKAGARKKWRKSDTSDSRGHDAAIPPALADGQPDYGSSFSSSFPSSFSSSFPLPTSSEEEESGATHPPPRVSPARVAAALDQAQTNGHAVAATRQKMRTTLGVLQAGFDEFWAHWPRHVDKHAAENAWRKLKPTVTLTDLIVQAVDAQKASSEWLRDGGRFIPYPATWLNGHRWDDELRGPPSLAISEQSQQNVEAGRRVVARLQQQGRPT